MAFTAQEVSNAAAAVLQFYQTGPFKSQTIQNKPLLKQLEQNQKTFSGGNGTISIPVKGNYTTTIQGYNTSDVVSYANPANGLRAVYKWYEIHGGVTMTETELKINGQSVTDEMGKDISDHSGRDEQVLTDLLKDKIEDMMEGIARGKQAMYWADGTQDAKLVPGITSLITDTPNLGTTGGIDRSIASNWWWRSKAYVGTGANATGAKITSSTSLQTLTQFITTLYRQLRRYAQGSPNYGLFAGSAFLDLLNAEIRAKGFNSMSGWTSKSATDISIADINFNPLGTFVYDPSLDDMGYADRCYFIDLNAIKLRPMVGEIDKTRNPARPFNQYVLYKAQTWTGALVADQLNTSAVVQAA